MSRLPLSNSGRATKGWKIIRVMHGAGQRFEIGPARSEVVTSDKESAEAAFTIEHPKAPKSNMQRAVIQPISGRSGTTFSGFSMTLKTIVHQEIARRRFDVASPAPQLLAHQLFGKLPDGFRMTPATSNSARNSSSGDFVAGSRFSTMRFEEASRNGAGLDAFQCNL